jgi:hypothetical protein
MMCYGTNFEHLRIAMRRREFIAGLGSVAAWPCAVQGQQALPVVGFIAGPNESRIGRFNVAGRSPLAS